MGFQFNHVGGGTKTRRPITLHMQYNAGCVQPHCFLVTEDFGDQEVTLEELQVRRVAGSFALPLLYSVVKRCELERNLATRMSPWRSCRCATGSFTFKIVA